eukprot:GHVU01189748.1.p1 GENE.GHVU01189748.1~~GHVU01189748.1.p1  ORF type:complete len:400 (-),score=106.84 GHVU01189748.1:265-1464(-)
MAQSLRHFPSALYNNRCRHVNRTDFSSWRDAVISEAANEAGLAKERKLKRLFVAEKLIANNLQKKVDALIEKSAIAEDAFRKISEVTGLSDVNEIVEKAQNWESEHLQLKNSAAEAEGQVEALRHEVEDLIKESIEESDNESTHSSRRESRGAAGGGEDDEDVETKLKKTLRRHEKGQAKVEQALLAREKLADWLVDVMTAAPGATEESEAELRKRARKDLTGMLRAAEERILAAKEAEKEMMNESQISAMTPTASPNAAATIPVSAGGIGAASHSHAGTADATATAALKEAATGGGEVDDLLRGHQESSAGPGVQDFSSMRRGGNAPTVGGDQWAPKRVGGAAGKAAAADDDDDSSDEEEDALFALKRKQLRDEANERIAEAAAAAQAAKGGASKLQR